MDNKTLIDRLSTIMVMKGVREVIIYIQNNPGAYWKDIWENSRVLQFTWPDPVDEVVEFLTNGVNTGYLRCEDEHYYTTQKADDVLVVRH